MKHLYNALVMTVVEFVRGLLLTSDDILKIVSYLNDKVQNPLRLEGRIGEFLYSLAREYKLDKDVGDVLVDHLEGFLRNPSKEALAPLVQVLVAVYDAVPWFSMVIKYSYILDFSPSDFRVLKSEIERVKILSPLEGIVTQAQIERSVARATELEEFNILKDEMLTLKVKWRGIVKAMS